MKIERKKLKKSSKGLLKKKKDKGGIRGNQMWNQNQQKLEKIPLSSCTNQKGSHVLK